jgi:hypothetical protein
MEAEGMDMLYVAGGQGSAAWPSEWVPLGAAESCEFVYDEDPLTDALIGFDLHGRCASVSFSIGKLSSYGYWVLTRRRHPRVTAAHRAYRRKTRNRW